MTCMYYDANQISKLISLLINLVQTFKIWHCLALSYDEASDTTIALSYIILLGVCTSSFKISHGRHFVQSFLNVYMANGNCMSFAWPQPPTRPATKRRWLMKRATSSKMWAKNKKKTRRTIKDFLVQLCRTNFVFALMAVYEVTIGGRAVRPSPLPPSRGLLHYSIVTAGFCCSRARRRRRYASKPSACSHVVTTAFAMI